MYEYVITGPGYRALEALQISTISTSLPYGYLYTTFSTKLEVFDQLYNLRLPDLGSRSTDRDRVVPGWVVAWMGIRSYFRLAWSKLSSRVSNRKVNHDGEIRINRAQSGQIIRVCKYI